MLFDLTRVSGQRVDQVDELQLAGRHWVRSTDVFIALGGAVVGALVVNRRRIQKIVDAARVPEGKFVLPGTAPFSVNDFELMEMHDHPSAP